MYIINKLHIFLFVKKILFISFLVLILFPYKSVFAAEIKSPKIQNAKQQLIHQYKNINFQANYTLSDWQYFLVLQTLQKIPQRHVESIESITFELSDEMKGEAQAQQFSDGVRSHITLDVSQSYIDQIQSCNDYGNCMLNTNAQDNQQFIALLLHEIGHAVDSGVSTSGNMNEEVENAFRDGSINIARDDISLDFYRLCFKSNTVLKEECSDASFVSQYAVVSAAEDFAETFAAYVLGGDIRHNVDEVLLQKYQFLSEYIFDVKSEKVFVSAAKESDEVLFSTAAVNFDLELFLLGS